MKLFLKILIFVGLIFPSVAQAGCPAGPAPDSHSGCPAGPAAYPQEMDMSQFTNITGIGYDFEMFSVELTNQIVVAGIPAGSTVIQAYLWHVEKSGTCPGTYNFGGTNFGGTQVGFGDLATTQNHPRWGVPVNCGWVQQYCNSRYDVTARVTGNGTYTFPNLGGNSSNTLMVVYYNPANTDRTTIAVADGMFLWHPSWGNLNDGYPPDGTLLDWSCEGNPVCSTADTKWARAGGSELHEYGTPDQMRDELYSGPGGALLWESNPTILSPGHADLDIYVNSPGMPPGSSRLYWSIGDALQSNKTTYWTHVLAASTSCPTEPPTPLISKSVNPPVANTGDTVTYTLHYDVSAGSPAVFDNHNDNDGNCVPLGWSRGYGADCFMETGGVVTRGSGGSYNPSSVIYNRGSFGTNGVLEFDLMARDNDSNDMGGVMFRYDPNTNNGYRIQVRADNSTNAGSDFLRLSRLTGGTYVTLANFNLNAASLATNQWFRLRVVLDGCNIQLLVDYNRTGTFVNVGTQTDCAYTSGAGGYYRNGPSDRVHHDNFRWTPCPSVSNVVISDNLEPEMCYLNMVSGQAPVSIGSPPGNLIAWNMGNLPCGASGDLVFRAVICGQAAAPACQIPNTGQLTSDETGTMDSNTVTVDILDCGETPTHTRTRTRTVTRTITLTPTPTITLTPTTTVTVTVTPTVTITITTPTFTITVTRTVTVTPTPTRTITFSPTVTVTYTVTPTPTPTFTITVTRTVTVTPTPTRTITFSPTITVTYTVTPTPTPTFTITVTRTVTPTPTPTRTITFSPTITVTYTITPTPTPTFTLTVTRTVTATSTPTRTITFSPTITVTYTVTPTPTSTYTLTATRTITVTPTPTETITFSPTTTFTYTVTSTITFTSTPTVTFTATPTATSTFTLTLTPTRTLTFTQTPISLPYRFNLTVYNEAGEVVRVLFNGVSAGAVAAPAFSRDIITGGYDELTITLDTLLGANWNELVWAGDNDNGQPVISGVYHLKFESVDQFGKVTSFIKPITVINPPRQTSLEIYNSAGEIVATLNLKDYPDAIVDFRIENHIFSPLSQPGAPAQGGLAGAPGGAGPSPTGSGGTAVDAAGNIYVADPTGHQVRRITPNGSMTIVAGDGSAGYSGNGFQGSQARLNTPTDVAVDAAGNVYIVDSGNHVIRRIAPDGIISTVAGTGVAGNSGSGGVATATMLNNPQGIFVDANGMVYVADTGNNQVVSFQPAGLATVLPMAAGILSAPRDVVVNSATGTVYIADTGNHRVVSLPVGGGAPGVVAGDGNPGFNGLQLNSPGGLALDAAGNLYIADTANHRIRQVDPAGNISTVAGNGSPSYSGDGNVATAAGLNAPGSVAVTAGGRLLIGDGGNGVLRQVVVGVISTLAGQLAALVDDPTIGNIQPGSGMVVHLLDTRGNEYIVEWNGNSNAGRPVASGSYLVKMVSIDAENGVNTRKLDTVQLIRNTSTDREVEIITAPNPAATEMRIFYSSNLQGDAAWVPGAGALPPGSRGVARMYNLAGELVLEAVDPAGRGWMAVNVQALASGVYIVVVEHRQGGGLVDRSSTKAVVLH